MLEVRGREKRVKRTRFPRMGQLGHDLTLPFSNLLTLFLLVIMSRSPVSPRSPMMLRKTLASVPPPPTLPVQMVTRYFITEKDRRRQIHTRSARRARPGSMCLTGQRLGDERSSSRKLSDDLVVVFVHIQPAATLEGILFHRQGFQQRDLQRVVSSAIIRTFCGIHLT